MNRFGFGKVLIGLAMACLLTTGAMVQPSAGQDEPKSSPEALIVYSDAANFQNNGAFELAAEEWAKFLKKFPKDPLAAKAQHYAGVCNLQLKNFEKAAAAFQEVVTNFPKFDNIQDAYLNLGWCQYSLAGQKNDDKLYAAAAKTFKEQVEKFPGKDGKYNDQALFFWGEAEYHQGNRKQAVSAYDQLVKNHPKSSLRRDALYALGVTHEELEQYADAGQIYDLFLKEFPESDLVTEIKMRKAETVLQAGDYGKAATMFGEVAAVENFPSIDHAISRQAFCLAKQDKFAEAGELYARISNEYKDSIYAEDARISAARCFYRAGQDKQAITALQAVVDAGKNDVPEAAHWLSRIYLRTGKANQVIPLVEKVLPQAADDPYLVNLKMDKADALYEAPATREQAYNEFLAIATDHPDHSLAPQALYNAQFAALELKKYQDGIQQAEQFLAKYPEADLVPDVRYVQAECNLQLKQYDKAEAIYRDLVESDVQHPEREQWQMRLALSLFLQKKYAEVVAVMEPAVSELKKADNVAEAQFLIGASQFSLDKTKPAIPALEASLKANAKWRQADETAIFLARAYRAENRLDDAVKTISKAIADFPNSQHLAHAHYRLGEYSYAKEDYAKAVEEYDAVITGDAASPFTPYAIYGKGWSFLKTQKYAEAVAAFTDLIDKFQEHSLVADGHFARAMANRQDGKYQAAIDDVNEFLKSDPDLNGKSDALYERGLAEVALQKNAQAVDTFSQLLKDNEKYANADKVLYELAWAYKLQEGEDPQNKAVETFAKLAKQAPDSSLAAEAHFHVGESLYDEKKYDEAEKEYVAALKGAGKSDLGEKAIYKLGWSHFQTKDYEAALASFSDQVKTYPKGPLYSDALFMQAEAQFRLENYEAALPIYTAAKELKASSPTIEVLTLLHGGQSASQQEKWEDAISWLSAIPADHADSPYLAEAHYELGWAKQNAGQVKEAEKDYEIAAATSRGEVGARARFMIGELYFNDKKYDDAIKHFQRVMFGYGGDNATAAVKKWQAKSGYEAARCSEVQIKDAQPAARGELIADATKAYQYVVEKHADDPLAAQAKTRLEALAKL